jgi:hypothetical protein
MWERLAEHLDRVWPESDLLEVLSSRVARASPSHPIGGTVTGMQLTVTWEKSALWFGCLPARTLSPCPQLCD